MNTDFVSNLNPYTNDSSSLSSAHTSDPENLPQHVINTDEMRAKWLVSNNHVHLVPHLQAFNVSNENGDVVVVKLNPNKCSCPEAKGCSHIRAVLISINQSTKSIKKNTNLTKLRANIRNGAKSGRKAVGIYRHHNLKDPKVQIQTSTRQLHQNQSQLFLNDQTFHRIHRKLESLI